MYKQKLNKYFSLVFFILISINTGNMFAGLPPLPKGAPSINLSPEQVDRMTKELENIDKFFNSLPPEEQMEFLKQVEEAQKMINSLSEEELSQLVKDMEQLMPELFEGIPMDALTKPISQPETLTPVNIPAPKKQEKIILTKDEEIVLLCIESLTKLINEYNVKINSAPEIGLNIQRWIRTGKIQNWKKESSFKDVAPEIERLAEKIMLLKSQDPVTSEYRHLKEIIKEKNILAILQKLEKSLLSTVPNIDIPTLGIEKMNKTSKEHLQKALTAIGDVITNDNVAKKIEDLLIKFNPEAAKIKASEKKETLRAQQQAQIKPQQGRTIVAGKASSENEGFVGARDMDYSFYGRDNVYGKDSYTTPSTSSSSLPTSASSPKTTSAPSASSQAKSSSANPAPKFKEEKGLKETSFDKSINEITDQFADISETITNTKYIQDLEQYLKSNDPIESKTVETVDQLQSDIDSLTKKINSFNRKIKDLGVLQKKYKSKLVASIKGFRLDLSKLRTSINNIKSKKHTLSPEKQYAFFKENIVFPEDKTKPLQTSNSLIELANSIEKLENAIQK